MRKSKTFKAFLITGILLALGSGSVYAGTGYQSYNTTVAKFNGNGYTGYQTKQINGANGGLSSSSVGGDYLVDARMQELNGPSGLWTRDIDDGHYYELDGHPNHSNGDSIRIQFSNDWNTPVNVQVRGKWRSN